MATLRQLAKIPAAAMLADKLVKLAAGAALTIVVARHLGASDLGVFSVIMACASFLVPLSGIGLNNIVVRQLAEHADGMQAMSLLYTAVTMRFALAVVLAIATWLILYYFVPAIDDPGTLLAAASLLMLQSFYGFVLFEFFLNYQGLFHQIAYLKAAVSLVGITIKLVLLEAGFGIAALLFMTGIELAVTGLAQYLTFYRLQRPFAPGDPHWPAYHPRWFRVSHAGGLLRRSAWIWVSGALSVLYLKVDVVLISALAGSEQAGVYAAASRLSELWYVFPATIAARYYPRVLARYRQGWESYLSILRKFGLGYLLAGFLVAAGMTWAAPRVVELLFGDPFMAAVPVLRIHVWGGCFIFVQYLVHQHLVITGQEPLTFLSHGAGAVINILLNLLLIPRLGISGAAWATLVAYAFASFFFLFFNATTRHQLRELILVRRRGGSGT